jgi:polyhydroxyalkanoate synthesis regulator phasin
VSAKVIVRAAISIEVLNKLKAVKRIPRREWGKNLIPEYFGNYIEKYTETREFEYLAKDVQIEVLKAQVSSRDFFGKLKDTELAKAKAEIERLKKELEDLKNPPRAA